MSGGGGGGGRASRIRGGRVSGTEAAGSGSGNRGNITECLTLYRGAGLASPKSAVLSKVQAGDTMNLDAQPQGPHYVLYAVKSGARAGVVTHERIDQIIRCIVEEGHTYIAYIKSIDGGRCVLEIRMES